MIGEEPSARIHEIRDVLARNNVPFGFYRSDSAEGRQALARLGVSQPAGPVVALFNGIVLVDPGNAEVAEALGTTCGPAGQAYDVVIVGAGPACLAAAVYAASEGLATALLELEAFGGEAGTSSGSGTTWASRAASAERNSPCELLIRHGGSVRTSSTATRPPRWPPRRTCTWWVWRMEARSGAAP